MRKPLFLLVFCTIVFNSMAQTITGNAVPSVQFSDANGRFIPMGSNGVQGSPYVFEHFGIGKVMMSNGVEAIDSNINYSLFDHKLYYIKNKGMYLVNEPVKAFQLNNVDKDNNNIVLNFASAYPTVESNTPSTFYEIMANGTLFQLLKYASKYIKESTEYGGAPIKAYAADNIYYVYDLADKKMLILGSTLNLKNIKKTLPNKTSQIDELITKLQLNGKKEDDLKKLFEKLN
jgi:hypothetical protein